MRRPALLGLAGALACLAACEHARPFGEADLGPNVPAGSAFPRRLTFGAGENLTPAFLPDGSGIVYSYLRTDLPSGGHCLGILPPEGGSRTAEICHVVLRPADSTNALFEPAVGPDGWIAYVRESAVPGRTVPMSRELVVARLGAADSVRVLQRMPFTLGGQLYGGASHLRWVDAHTLVYVAGMVAYRSPPSPRDTVRSGLDVVRVSFGGDSASSTVIPGTRYASSVALDSLGGIYFTLGGDSRVYRTDAAGGTAAVVYDFGAAGIARDVAVSGGTLVAVVGGSVTFALDTVLGYVQRDGGGYLYKLDLAAGTTVPIAPQDSRLRHPALSPSGARVVAESKIPGGEPLWLYQVP